MLSLVVSMVLFISASAFTMYATGGSEQVLDVANYDVAYVSYPSENTDYFTDRLDTAFVNRLYHELKETDGVADSSCKSSLRRRPASPARMQRRTSPRRER